MAKKAENTKRVLKVTKRRSRKPGMRHRKKLGPKDSV